MDHGTELQRPDLTSEKTSSGWWPIIYDDAEDQGLIIALRHTGDRYETDQMRARSLTLPGFQVPTTPAPFNFWLCQRILPRAPFKYSPCGGVLLSFAIASVDIIFIGIDF